MRYDVATARPEHKEATREFYSIVEAIERAEGQRGYEVYRDFLLFASTALANAMLPKGSPRWQQNEDAYMDRVGRLRSKEDTTAKHARMMGIVGTSLKQNGTDFLSTIHMELAQNKGGGQFFTPWELSYTCAAMTLGDVEEVLAKAAGQGRDHILLQEPACGCGSMALAANHYMKSKGIDLAKQVHWVMIDVDLLAVRASFLQMVFTEASAQIVHGNALTLEEWASYTTPAAFVFPKREKDVREFRYENGVKVYIRRRAA